MNVQSFSLHIEGYWREIHKNGLPAFPGIFFVFETKYNILNGTVSVLKIIYIGEDNNIKERVANHPLYAKWKSYVNEGNELSFCAARADAANRTRIKAAFIFNRKPIANPDYKDSFPFDDTTILVAGRTLLLEKKFSVTRT